ncbi:MAG: hydroxypyruvate isomerase family protein [Granulosicoccus sp.]
MGFKYSANVGFLWEHLPLPDRIRAAAQAGFDAVECHFPYEFAADEIASVLNANNIPMIGINTLLGPPDEGYFGVAAIAGKEALAQKYIDQAIHYAAAVGANNVNVVAGASADSSTSEAVYLENLSYACQKAADLGITIVIEPLNPRSVPGYHFSRVEHAVSIIDSVAEDNLKLMFDFFHTQIVQGDLATLLVQYRHYIGHIQISAVHDRGEPDVGEVNYPFLLNLLATNGYKGYIGAEYKPRGESVEFGLGWLDEFRQH